MRLAIADPPYPPMFGVRFDLPAPRVTVRSRANRWYGSGAGMSGPAPADYHADASKWDALTAHRQLLEHLVAEYDGWVIATTPDGLGAYHPLPIEADVLAWVNTRAMPGGSRIHGMWEAVIAYVPRERRARGAGMRIPNVLTTSSPNLGFAGAKPPAWTRWVLDVLGYDPDTDELTDLFPGSGAVTAAAAQHTLL